MKAAGPVSRILSAVAGRTVIPLGHALLRGSSDLPGGCDAPSRHDLPSEVFTSPRSLPIWSCSVWGLPCPLHYCRGGALLPHLFTLTPRIRRRTRRYVLCGTSRQPGLNPASRTLSGTLLCGVRTFLPRRPKAPRATVRSSCLQGHYMRQTGFRLRASGALVSHSRTLRVCSVRLLDGCVITRSLKPEA